MDNGGGGYKVAFGCLVSGVLLRGREMEKEKEVGEESREGEKMGD